MPAQFPDHWRRSGSCLAIHLFDDILWHMLLVLDTDVVAAGVMSATGASRYLLESVGLGRLRAAASVPLLLEYEAVLKREETLRRAEASLGDIDTILDQLAAMLVRVDIWYLWRPQLKDRNDDMVLEAAANAGATHIVTFNVQDFGAVPMRFGIDTCQPAEIARRLRCGSVHEG